MTCSTYIIIQAYPSAPVRLIVLIALSKPSVIVSCSYICRANQLTPSLLSTNACSVVRLPLLISANAQAKAEKERDNGHISQRCQRAMVLRCYPLCCSVSTDQYGRYLVVLLYNATRGSDPLQQCQGNYSLDSSADPSRSFTFCSFFCLTSSDTESLLSDALRPPITELTGQT